MTAQPTPTSTGHRSGLRGRRVPVDVVLAVVLPTVVLGAMLLVRPATPSPDQVVPPVTSELTTASVVCPGALPGADGDVVGVTSLSGAAGGLVVGLGDDTVPVEVRPGRVTELTRGDDPVVVAGARDLAPGLVAGESTTGPLTATDCRPIAAEHWFTGVGSGATHSSVVELVNPYGGPALADLQLWAPAGPLDVPALRGVSVPGGTSTRLDLGEIVPRRGELVLQVGTSRGRLAVNVIDTYDELGSGPQVREWLPPQDMPATSSLLLGLARGTGERTLVLANPGANELRATMQIVTPRSVFTPAGSEPVRVPPGTTKQVRIDDMLTDATSRGAIGLLVEATEPMTTTLRQVVGGDLSLVAPASEVAEATGLVVPPGRKRLLLADPAAVGAATVVAYTGDGELLMSKRVELVPDTGLNISLPDDAALVTLTPERTTVRAAVLLVEEGTAVVSMRELVRTSLVPDVRPGLP